MTSESNKKPFTEKALAKIKNLDTEKESNMAQQASDDYATKTEGSGVVEQSADGDKCPNISRNAQRLFGNKTLTSVPSEMPRLFSEGLQGEAKEKSSEELSK
jgi:hypothetical protein